MLVETLLVTVLVPGACAFGIALAGPRFSRAREASIALAMVAAVIAGSWGIVGRPAVAPQDISQRMPHLAVLASLASLALLRLPGRRGWFVLAALALGVAYLVTRPILGSRWGTIAPLALVGLAATQLGYTIALRGVARRTSPRLGATVLVISVAAAAAAAGASGSLTIGQLGGAAAAGAGAVWLVTLVRPAPIDAMTPVAGAIGWAVVAIGAYYAAMPLHVAGLVLAIPVVALVTHAATHRRLPVLSHTAIVVVTLMTAGIAVQRAVSPPSETSEADYGYE